MQAQDAQARAEQEVFNLQDHAKSVEQDVSKLKQQLAGSQSAVAQKEQELKQQVHSDDVCTCLSCALDSQFCSVSDNTRLLCIWLFQTRHHAPFVCFPGETQVSSLCASSTPCQADHSEAVLPQRPLLLLPSTTCDVQNQIRQYVDERHMKSSPGSLDLPAVKQKKPVALQVEVSQKLVRDLRVQLAAAQAEVSSISQQSQAYLTESNQLKSQLQALHAQQDSLRGQLHTGQNILDLKEELSQSQADRSSLQRELQQVLAECKSLRGELGDAQLEHNCAKCQLEAAVVDKNSAQGQLDTFKNKYDRLKGQHSKSQAVHSNQERQCHDALLGAQQHSTQLADFQVAHSMSASSAQPAKPAVNGPWAQHAQQQQRPNSHALDRNSPQGPPVRSSATHISGSMVGMDPPVMGAAQQQRPHMKEARGPWEAAQHVQQKHFPNSHKLDRNISQGPPVHSLKAHNSANKIYTAQQQRQRPGVDPLQDLPPGFSNQSATTHHAHAPRVNRAALAGQEEGRNGTALAQEQQRPTKKSSHKYSGGQIKQQQM